MRLLYVIMTRFDCVYPTRTARFGVAFVPNGTLRLKGKDCAQSLTSIHPHCGCSTCANFTQAALHMMFKENNPMASQLLTKHNIYYMMTLMRSMRKAILEGDDEFEAFVLSFLQQMFPRGDVPLWTVEALASVDIHVSTTCTASNDNNSNSALHGEDPGVGDE